MKILIIDDSEIVTRSLQQMLSQFAVELSVYHSGTEALKHSQGNYYDLAFIDVLMPVKSGIDTAKALIEQGAIGHLVMMTGSLSPHFQLLIKKINPLATLIKPITHDHVAYYLKIIDPAIEIKSTESMQVFYSHAMINHQDSVFNAVDGLKRFGNQVSLYVENLMKFSTSLEHLIIVLFEYTVIHLDAESHKNLANFRFELHNLKGNAAFIGAYLLSDMAKLVDYNLKDEDVFTRNDFDQLHAVAELTIQEIKDFVEEIRFEGYLKQKTT